MGLICSQLQSTVEYEYISKALLMSKFWRQDRRAGKARGGVTQRVQVRRMCVVHVGGLGVMVKPQKGSEQRTSTSSGEPASLCVG